MFLVLFVLIGSLVFSTCLSFPIKIVSLKKGDQTIVLFGDLHETQHPETDIIESKEQIELRDLWVNASHKLILPQKNTCSVFVEDLESKWNLFAKYDVSILGTNSSDRLKRFITSDKKIRFLQSFYFL